MPDLSDQISQALKGHGADYVEVRIEEGESTRLLYRGRELEDVGMTTSLGGNVRALVNGGWGFVSFNTIEGSGRGWRMRCARRGSWGRRPASWRVSSP